MVQGVFFSNYSSSVFEAIIMRKFVLLVNLEGHNYYKMAVEYEVAGYLEKEGDFERKYNNYSLYMSNLKTRVQKYTNDVYFKDSDQDKEVSDLIHNLVGTGEKL